MHMLRKRKLYFRNADTSSNAYERIRKELKTMWVASKYGSSSQSCRQTTANCEPKFYDHVGGFSAQTSILKAEQPSDPPSSGSMSRAFSKALEQKLTE